MTQVITSAPGIVSPPPTSGGPGPQTPIPTVTVAVQQTG